LDFIPEPVIAHRITTMGRNAYLTQQFPIELETGQKPGTDHVFRFHLPEMVVCPRLFLIDAPPVTQQRCYEP
jgi:hypothetical protein